MNKGKHKSKFYYNNHILNREVKEEPEEKRSLSER